MMGSVMRCQTQLRKRRSSKATAKRVPAQGDATGDWNDGGNELVTGERQMQS